MKFRHELVKRSRMGDVKYFYSSIPLHRSLRSRVTSEKERAKACSLLDSSMLNRKKNEASGRLAWPYEQDDDIGYFTNPCNWTSAE